MKLSASKCTLFSFSLCFIICSALSEGSERLRYITGYEFVNVTIKRSPVPKTARIPFTFISGIPHNLVVGADSTIVSSLSFTAFGQFYQVLFDPYQPSIFVPDAELNLQGKNKSSYLLAKKSKFFILEGYLREEKETKVYGYVLEDTFTGAIFFRNSTLLLESFDRYYELSNGTRVPGNAIAFRSLHVKPYYCNETNLSTAKLGKELREKENVSSECVENFSEKSKACRWKENGVVICTDKIWKTVEFAEGEVHNETQSPEAEIYFISNTSMVVGTDSPIQNGTESTENKFFTPNTTSAVLDHRYLNAVQNQNAKWNSNGNTASSREGKEVAIEETTEHEKKLGQSTNINANLPEIKASFHNISEDLEDNLQPNHNATNHTTVGVEAFDFNVTHGSGGKVDRSFNSTSTLAETEIFIFDSTQNPENFDLDAEKNGGRPTETASSSFQLTCSVKVVADYSYFTSMGNSVNRAAAEMAYYIKMADAIIKEVSINSQHMRFIVKDVTIFTSPLLRNGTFANASEPKSLDDYLHTLSGFHHHHENYCLSIVFTGKRFSSDNFAVLTPDSKSSVRNGGICSDQHENEESMNSKLKNVGVVTAVDTSGTLQPAVMNTLLTASLIRFSLGANSENSSCSSSDIPDPDRMKPTDLDGFKIREKWFQACNRKSVEEVVRKAGDCLKPFKSVCGNGIVEPLEECDCGTEEACRSQKCCAPPGGAGGDHGCTFKRSEGRECDSRLPCCTDGCKVVPLESKQFCGEGDRECNPRFCDGNSDDCPYVPLIKDGTPCMGVFSCSSGYCNSTICRDHNLDDCDCRTPSEQCHLCCRTKDEGECGTLASITGGPPLYRLPGTPCDGQRGICHPSGNCVDVQAQSAKGPIALYQLNCLFTCLVLLVTQFFHHRL